MERKFHKIWISIFAVALLLGIPKGVFPYSVTDFEAIDRQIEADVKSCQIPGMAVAVVDCDNVLFSKAYGNCESVDTPFIIGSMSKSFTALSVMQLVEKGKIDLDAPVSNYLDCSLYLKNPADGERISVRQLLNHTSGLGAYQKFKTAKITESYGTHVYANVNYNLLGKIIEAASGMLYSEYVEKNIFSPLEMEKSSATLLESNADGLGTGFRNYFGLPIAGKPDYPTDRSWSLVSAGYISSSAADMAKYLQMYLNGGSCLVSENSINAMFYDNVPTDDSGQSFYGMGWGMHTDFLASGEPILNHSGLVENYTSNMFIFPESGIGIVVLANMNDYFVDNNLLGNIILPLLGGQQIQLPNRAYSKLHLLLNLIYLFVLSLAVFPIVLIKRWKEKKRRKTTGGKALFIQTVLYHFVFPLFLLCLPSIVAAPLWVVWYFVKDLFLVLTASAALLFATGIYKIAFLVKNA